MPRQEKVEQPLAEQQAALIDEMLQYCRPLAVVEKVEELKVHRHVECIQELLRHKWSQAIKDANDVPILASYGSDGTPMGTMERQSTLPTTAALAL